MFVIKYMVFIQIVSKSIPNRRDRTINAASIIILSELRFICFIKQFIGVKLAN